MLTVRFTMLAAATALSVAACGSSNTPTPSTSPSTVVASPTSSPSGPPSGGDAQVRGLIASIAGNAVQVTQKKGSATVDFTGSTKVTEVSRAALADVTAGSCVSARAKDAGRPAASVRVSPAVDGKCPPAEQPTTSGKPTPAQGTVASVAGNTITINTDGGTPQTVTVSDKTKYTKEAPATSQAISQGKCLTALGSENGGALQATAISLRPANNGKCPDKDGGPHRH